MIFAPKELGLSHLRETEGEESLLMGASCTTVAGGPGYSRVGGEEIDKRKIEDIERESITM